MHALPVRFLCSYCNLPEGLIAEKIADHDLIYKRRDYFQQNAHRRADEDRGNRMSFLSGIIYHFSSRFSLQMLGQDGDILYQYRGSVL